MKSDPQLTAALADLGDLVNGLRIAASLGQTELARRSTLAVDTVYMIRGRPSARAPVNPERARAWP